MIDIKLTLEEHIVVLNLMRILDSRLHILDSPKPLLMQALDEYCRTESVEALPNLFRSLSSVSFSAFSASKNPELAAGMEGSTCWGVGGGAVAARQGAVDGQGAA